MEIGFSGSYAPQTANFAQPRAGQEAEVPAAQSQGGNEERTEGPAVQAREDAAAARQAQSGAEANAGAAQGQETAASQQSQDQQAAPREGRGAVLDISA